MADTVGSAENEEDGNNRNEEIKNYSEWEREVLHGGEGPGHGGG